jgi:hypothetical protein
MWTHIRPDTFGEFLIVDSPFDLAYRQPTLFDFRPTSSYIMSSPSSSQLVLKAEAKQEESKATREKGNNIQLTYPPVMNPSMSSRPALKAEPIQKEARSTPEEMMSTQLPSSPIMDPAPSSQLVSEAETIHETDETSQLFMLPSEVLVGILKFLDMKTLISGLFLVCTLFCPSFKRCSATRYPFLGHLGHIYEKLMFSRGGPIIQPTSEDYSQPLYFRPNVNLSLHLEGVAQPAGLQIHVITTSDREEIRLEEIVSMIITTPIPNGIMDDVPTGHSDFLAKLPANRLKNLKNLKLNGFEIDRLFSLFSEFQLDWLHIVYYSVKVWRFSLEIASFPGCKRLHLNFNRDCDLGKFPVLPNSLKEVSLHFSNRIYSKHPVYLDRFKNIRRM